MHHAALLGSELYEMSAVHNLPSVREFEETLTWHAGRARCCSLIDLASCSEIEASLIEGHAGAFLLCMRRYMVTSSSARNAEGRLEPA